jgi:predicted O-methyltransferase YrrM
MLSSNHLFQLKKITRYFFAARYRGGHGAHSPFLYHFITGCLGAEVKGLDEQMVKEARASVFQREELMALQGHGTGSIKGDKQQLPVGKLIKGSAIRPKYGRLLYRLVQFFQPATIVELGTCGGISTLYLAAGHNLPVLTVEGEGALVGMARQLFEKKGMNNISTYHMTFDRFIHEIFSTIPGSKLVFLDGDHTKTATLRYFKNMLPFLDEGSVLVLDDIHGNPGMDEAWKTIISKPEVSLSLDFFQLGVLFFNKKLSKEHKIIRY